MKYQHLYNVLFAASVLMACAGNEPRERVVPEKPAEEVAVMEAINRQLTEKDRDIIDAFIRRKGWAMQEYPDGYYAMILKEGKGAVVNNGSQVELRCTVRLLNGTLCYAPHSRSFVVGNTDEIVGLHKALLRLRQGTEARFVFPPHLAYGLLGDRDKIPARAIVLFDIELLNVS